VVAEEEAIVDVPIARHRTDRKRMGVDRDGKSAVTQLSVLERYDESSLLDIDLRTGRTHQIRVHMAYIRHPIIGDKVYGGGTSARIAQELNARRQMLHAATLGLAVPGTSETTEFQAPLPADMERVLAQLRSEGA
jgi:23S rRNA pseudouridine1911/1915/1917 synthase